MANQKASSGQNLKNNFPFKMKFLMLPILTIANVVIDLTQSNFDKFLKDNPANLVEFYAPWCHYCTEMAGDYEEAAKQLESTAKLGRINCDVETKLCEKYSVDRYPTMKIFHDGQPFVYTGDRSNYFS